MNSVRQIISIEEALELLYKHHMTLVSKGYGQKAIMYRVYGDKIIVINSSLKSFISKDEFIESFYQNKFYLVDIEVSDEEIDQNHIVYRQ